MLRASRHQPLHNAGIDLHNESQLSGVMRIIW